MKRNRFIIDDSIYPIFITTTTIDWVQVFRDKMIAEKALILFEQLRCSMNIIIFAYVLMPSHLHAITKTNRKGDLSKFMQKWKSLSARMILEYSANFGRDWLRLFEKSVIEHKRESIQKYQVWQPRFDDFAIRDEKQFLQKLNYIHGNPIKHKLVEECYDYLYSSVHDYLGGKNRYITIELWSPWH